MKMKTDNDFKLLVERKYREMKDKNLTEDFLDEKLGGIKIFLKKPQNTILTFTIGDDQIYIGSESM